MAYAPNGIERLSRLSTVTVNQLKSSYKGNNYAVVGDDGLLFNVLEQKGGWISTTQIKFPLDGVDRNGVKLFFARREKGFFTFKVGLYIRGALTNVVHFTSQFCGGPIINIKDARGGLVVRLKGRVFNSNKFELQSMNEIAIGSVKRKSRGWKKELFSRKDDYVISFPFDLVEHVKLAVILATVLIDFKYHEYQDD